MDLSNIHETGIEGLVSLAHNQDVDSRGKVNQRIRDLLQTRELSQVDFCGIIEEPTTKFNNYLNNSSKNGIPPEVASKVADEFGVTLDWIYRGRLSHLILPELREQLLKLEQARTAPRKRVARK